MLEMITTIVPHARDNAMNIAAGKAILRLAAKEKVGLVLFPAGFLSTTRERDVVATARPLLREARKLRIATVLGIDVESTAAKHGGKTGTETDELVRHQRLPYFVVAQSPIDAARSWRQRSTTARNSHLAPAAPEARRSLRVGRTTIDVLACGETFSDSRWSEDWKNRIVVNPTHTAAGARFFRAVERARRNRVAGLVRATHAWSAKTQLGDGTRTNIGRIEEIRVCKISL